MNFKERLLLDTQELAEKLNKQNYFMSSELFLGLSRVEKDLLYEQSRLMNSYVQVLGKRLEFYGVKFTHE
jgi:hypothetical protein